jgi:acyl-CoA synthetase (AMP-forming)/AMP-acid ligase II
MGGGGYGGHRTSRRETSRFTHAVAGNATDKSLFLTGRTVVTTSRDIDVAKERLVDSLSTARDATRTAVRDDIAPAVVAAVGAAREAAAPVYAETASRATDAVKALRGSDAAQTVRSSSAGKAVEKAAAKALKRKVKSDNRGKRLKFLAIFGGGVAAFAVIKRRSKPAASAYPVPTDVKPEPTGPSNPTPTVESPTSGS